MTTKTNTPKISCQNLWKVFGPNPQRAPNLLAQGLSQANLRNQHNLVVAVQAASFEVQAGEIFVIMGLSGSGKSTLIRCLPRLIEPTQGQIWFHGQDITKMDTQALRTLRRQKMSMVFQRFGLFPHRRVIDNVAYGLEVRGEKKAQRRKKATEILELVGLQGWENHYPDSLSGGMQQRVGLARALAVDPEILLCDEPFSALDPLIRRDMQNELLRLQKLMHKTIIFITHDFQEAIKLGDHIAIMKEGRIIQIGTAQELIANPADEYVREFTKDVPRAKVLTAKSIMTPLPDNPPSNLPTVSAETTLEALIPQLAQQNGPLLVQNEAGLSLGLVATQNLLLALANGEVG